MVYPFFNTEKFSLQHVANGYEDFPTHPLDTHTQIQLNIPHSSPTCSYDKGMGVFRELGQCMYIH